MKRISIFTLSVSLLLAACGGDEEQADPCESNNPPPSCSSNSDNNANSTTNNANSTANSVNSTTNNACVPLTECPADSCGQVDDTCDGVLECGACPCDGTTVVEAGCGPCGIGVRSCTGTEQGTCWIPGDGALDAITDESCEADLVYVNLTASGDGDGTMNSPRNDIQGALTQAVDDGATALVVGASNNTPTLDAAIELVDGVHVIGGFDASLARTLEPTEFIVDATADGYALGLVAKGLATTTVFSGFDVTVADASTWAMGAQVDSSPGLLMQRVTIAVGAGGDGLAGSTGTAGTAGADGPPGNPGRLATSGGGQIAIGGGAVDGITGSACPVTNVPRLDSGYGGCGQTSADNGTLTFACIGMGSGDGETVGAADGGTPSQNSSSRNGDDGAAFTTPAAAGTNGSPDTIWVEDGVSGLWIADVSSGDGSSGLIGDAGAPGAGGGGGFAQPFVTLTSCSGAGAGSGATGGCPGTGGLGGAAGWPSVGILVRASQGVTLDEVEIVSGTAGNGGDGGLGGVGGDGGNGGQGSRFCEDGSSISLISGSGGDGGDGADGQDGGIGGGGAGGDSIGLLCVEQTFEADALMGINVMAGTPGNGGMGEMAAPAGMAEAMFGCTME